MKIQRKIVVGDVNLLKFMYPTYELINENNIPMFPSGPAIYNGDPSRQLDFVKAYENTPYNYIIIGNYSEIDLNDRRILAQIAFEKWRKGFFPKYLETIIDNMDSEQFMFNFKIKWVTGKWLDKELNEENTFLELVDALNKSKYEFVKRYFEVINDTRAYRIESSIMTFLLRAKNNSYIGKSFEYRKKLTMYKGTKLKKAQKAIEKNLGYNIDNYDLRLLNLLMSILDSTKNH